MKLRDILKEVGTASNTTLSKEITIRFDIGWNKDIGAVEENVLLAMSPDSSGIYSLGVDVERYIGIPRSKVVMDIRAGKETPDDAIIYGMCNTMNGGADIYFWTNGTRLAGAAAKIGVLPAIMEQVSHECVHLTRLVLTRAIARNMGADVERGEWLNFDFGGGASNWPVIGDTTAAKGILTIDEEAFATATGFVAQQVTGEFLKMASNYLTISER